MKYLNRAIEEKTKELLNYFPVVAVLGARQTGKSTLVEHLQIAGLKTVVFDPIQDIGGAREDPDFFLQNQSTPLFLDEIQYATPLVASIKRFIDQRKNLKGQFVLSGSQNLAVLKTVSESLAGRVAILTLFPMNQAELSSQLNRQRILRQLVRDRSFNPMNYTSAEPRPLYDAIWKGGYPGLIELPEHLYATYFESYLQTYIERDVRTASEIGSLPTFSRFIGLLAALTAQEINHSQLGRELGIDRKTSIAWTAIAAATYQWIEIAPYTRNPVKKIAGKPKGYFADTGFACYLQRITEAGLLAQHPLSGSLFETFIVLEIIKEISTWRSKPNLYHYRAYSGAEVDLLLEMNGMFYPVEIKMTTKPSLRDVKGIDSFRRCFPEANIGTGLIVCAVNSVQPLRENIVALPWWEL